MTRRSRDWNEGLAKDLRNTEFAREFILALLDDGISLQEALGETIRAYGLKEFARKIKMPSSNISRVINLKHNPSQRVLEQLLNFFNLRLAAILVTKNGKRKAA